MLRKVSLLAVVLAILWAAPATGRQAKQKVTGTALLAYVGVVTPPEVRFTATRIATRSEVQTWGLGLGTDSSLVPWLDGEITFVVNCNFNAAYRGPCWGTFEWDVPGADGVWIGTWTSPVMDLVTYESTFSMVGQGLGGTIDGKQLKFDGGSGAGEMYITGSVRIH
jgi:hypothetical protein